MKHDLWVVLGSQVISRGFDYQMAQHTLLKAAAAAVGVKGGQTDKVILSGGHNFHVRYNEKEVLTTPNFTFDAFAKGQEMFSEAMVMHQFLTKDHGLDAKHFLREELSATTEENALFVATMLKRTTFSDVKKIGIVALLYHMKRAMEDFKKQTYREGVTLEPVFAEDVLAQDSTTWVNPICAYYDKPKGGTQYDIEKIRQLLTEGKSLAELM